MHPPLTIAIPAYNRPDELAVLLETILSQNGMGFDVLVVEDNSPRAIEIERVVQEAGARYPNRRVRFFANERNLGYDGNIRRILELSEGEFTVFMGDDDVLHPGALLRLERVISQRPNLGVILRSYEQIDFATGKRIALFRYFSTDRFFPAGADTIRTFFRRSVSIAGFTIHTATARQFATAQFDGTLLYQLHLSANVLKSRDGYFIADVLTAMRKDENQRHFFGSAEAEKHLFSPSKLTADHSLNFMKGMFDVARAAEASTGLTIYDAIERDIANYSYAFLRLHARNKRKFAAYVRGLAMLGLGKYPLFWAYVAALAVLPTAFIDKTIARLKEKLPATPNLGSVYAGESVKS